MHSIWKKIVTAVALLLVVSSCVTSLHPLYTPDKLALRPELPGHWKSVDSNEEWFFKRIPDEKAYKLTLVFEESGKRDEQDYKVHLVQLGKYIFLDFYALPDDAKNQTFVLAETLPTHGFARMDFEGKQARLLLFDDGWIKSLFDERKIRLKHERLQDGSIVLTAPSTDLQKFFEKYAEEEKAYVDALILKKAG